MLPSSAGAEIGPEENSEAAGPIFKKLAFGVLTNDRTFAKRTEPSRVLFFWVEAGTARQIRPLRRAANQPLPVRLLKRRAGSAVKCLGAAVCGYFVGPGILSTPM